MNPYRQLRQVRATVTLLMAQLDTLDEMLASAPAPCDHPERERDASVRTFDEPTRWMCKRCGHIGGEKAAAEE